MAAITEYRQQTRVGGASLPGGSAAGQGLFALGKAAESIGRDLQIIKEQDAALWATTALSQAQIQWQKELNDRQQKAEPGAENFTGQTLADFDEYSAKVAEAAPSGIARQYINERLAAYRTQLALSALAYEAVEKSRHTVDTVEQSIEAGQVQARQNPGRFGELVAERLATIDILRLDPETKRQLRDAAQSKIARDAVTGMIDTDPAAALAELQKPVGEGLLAVEALDAEDRNVLLNRAKATVIAQQNQASLEVQRQQTREARELKARQEQTASDFVTALHDPAADPLTYQGVINSDLTSTQKLKFIGLLDAEGEGRVQRTNWVTYNELFGRVASGEIHPDNLAEEVLPFVGQGITTQNYSTLRTLAGSVATQEGEPAIVKGFLAQAKSQITKSTLFGSDPNGDRLYYEFTFKFMQELERQKAEGKSVDDLLNPESPDYMGPLVRNYVRTPQQQLNDMANDLRGVQEPPEVEARKPGETPEQYLQRVNP